MTPEEKKEYNRIQTAKTRAKKKALGIPTNDPEVLFKANKKYREKNPIKKISVSLEVFEAFDKKKKELELTSDKLLDYLLKNI